MEFRVTPNNTTSKISAVNIDHAGKLSASFGLDVTGGGVFHNAIQVTGSSIVSSGGLQVSNQIFAGGDLYATGLGATRVGFLDASGAGSGSTYVGLRYDATHDRAELAALTGDGAWRDVLIAPGAGAYAMFGDYSGGALGIAGYLEIKDRAGNIRKLAVVN